MLTAVIQQQNFIINEKTIMLKKIVFVSVLLASLGNAYAYQAEVGGALALIDPDHGDTSFGFAIDGTYYFTPVQTKSYPLNEAAFLNRASNVNAAVTYTNYDIVDNTTYNLGFEYYMPTTDLYFSAYVGETKIEEDDFEDFDTTFYGAEIGYLPTAGLLVAAGLVGYDHDFDDGVDPTLRAKYVTQVGQYKMNFEAGAAFGDLDAFNLGTDLYLDNTLSLGVGYSDTDQDNADTFEIRAKKFFTQQTSLEASINFADDGNIFALRGAYRF